MSQLYGIDFSGLDGAQQSTTVMSYAERFPNSTRRLRTSVVSIPGMDKNIQARVERDLSKHFIQYEITTNVDARTFLDRYEE